MKLQMRENEYSGKLITFCGLDGCGKTTQIKLLAKYLEEKGNQVFLTKQPTDFVRKSEIFRTYMDTPKHDSFDYRALSLLCASDRVQHSNVVITEKLKEGYIVISDRYFYSCLANLKARGYEQDNWIYEIAKSIPKPDVAFFLDIDVETAMKRVHSRVDEKDRYIDVLLQHRLRKQYLIIANENNAPVISTVNTEKQCFETIRTEVEKRCLKDCMVCPA